MTRARDAYIGLWSGLALCAAAPAQPASTATVSFTIERQPLQDALTQFGRQSGYQLLFLADVTADVMAPEVIGEFTPQTALEKLLADSGLRYEFVNERTISIQSAPAPAATGAKASPPTTDPSDDLEEIIVTAQKRNERLRDVPTAVTAIQAGQLSGSGLLRVADYQALVPGLSINDGTAGGGQISPSIRGVTTGAGGRPTVGIFVDDVPVGRATSGGFMPDIDPADLERIEVLRGPQGTLYGGGSMGGLIRFITKSPDFDAFSGRVEVGGTSVDGGGTGWSARGSLNAPLTESLAARVSAFTREDPGFIDNLQTSEDDFNVRHYEGGRLSVGARLGDAWAVRLSAATQRIEVDGNPILDIVKATGVHVCGAARCGDLETRRAPGADNSDDEDTIYDVRVTGNFGWGDFLSSTAYNERDYQSNFDFSPVLGGLASTIFGVPNLGVAVFSTRQTERFTQELRLSSNTGQFMAWQVGAFYTDEDTFEGQDVRAFDLATGVAPAPPLPHLQTNRGPTLFEELAGFGSLTFTFTPRFDLTLGARYSENTSSSRGVTTSRLTGSPVTTTTNSPESTEDSVTYLVNPRFKITDDVMVYARLATGFRPGGPNAVNPDPTVPTTFANDSVTNYEIGLKGQTPDGSLRFDGSLYRIDWEDIQVRLTSFGLGYYVNGGKAHSQGAEAALSWEPIDHLTFTGNVSYNEAELDDALGAAPAGTQLPDTPRWASYLNAEYDFLLGADWSTTIAAAWRYVDERPGSLAATPFVLPSYKTIDLNAAVANDRYRIALFARNIADERGYLSSFPFPPLEQVALIQPRTYGISVSASF